MTDDRRSNDSSRRKRNESEREEAIRRKRRIAKRNEELKRGKKVSKRSLDEGYIPANDARRRVESPRRSQEGFTDRDFESRKNPSRKAVPSNLQNKSRNSKKNISKKKKKKRISFKKIFGIIIAALLILLVIGGVRIAKLVNNISTDKMIAPVEVPMDQTVNILLLGMDVGDVNNPNDEAIKRTDTMMLVNFNPKTKKVNIVSIPRDTLITINGRRWKMNAAYPIGGDQRVITEVEQLLNVKINYLAKVNYKGFRDFIDAIGGVDMKIEHNMDYTDKSQNLRIDFKKGTTVHLDGKKAEEFFRWRKNNDGTGLPNGDIDRIKNQHAFLEQVVKKCTSPAIIFRIPGILKAVEQNVETNMTGSTIFKYGLKLATLKPSNIKMTTVKGDSKMIEGQSYFIFNKEANADLIKALNSSDTGSADIKPEDVRIKVLNATKISGLAATYQIELKQLGYKNVDTGNTDLRDKSVIMVDNDNIKNSLKKNFKSITDYESINSKYADTGYDVIVILGNDAKNY
ncbi:hypothetical protein UT300003_14180 [Clostridium sardiniense]